MIEIAAIIFLTIKIGEIVQEKGRKATWYRVLTVVLWLGGELLGAVIGLAIVGESLSVYLFALGGAVLGAITAFVIAKSLKPLAHHKVYKNGTGLEL